MLPSTPPRLTRWMFAHEQPEHLPLDHKAQEDIAWAADEIAKLCAELARLRKVISQNIKDLTDLANNHQIVVDENDRLHALVGEAQIISGKMLLADGCLTFKAYQAEWRKWRCTAMEGGK